MQTLRLILAGAVTLVLLGAMSLVAVAQTDEADETSDAPVVVTGTLDCQDGTGEGDDPIGQSTVTVHAWEATDSRLSGEASYTGRWQLYGEPEEDAGSVESVADVAVYEIVTDGGSWLCEASRTAEPRTGQDAHTLVFSGQDEYEGLTAYLHVDWSTMPFEFTGVILPGEAPPYAEPKG